MNILIYLLIITNIVLFSYNLITHIEAEAVIHSIMIFQVVMLKNDSRVRKDMFSCKSLSL